MSTLSEIQQLAIDYCPYVHFHQDEKYLPSSFDYILDKFPIIKKDGATGATGINFLTEMNKPGQTIMWESSKNGPRDQNYMLNIGDIQSGDGYSGKPDPNNVLYGDATGPNKNPVQYITAYTIGEIKNETLNTSFLDIVYTVYFCWNGTPDWHPWDSEEIILRFQKKGYTDSNQMGLNDYQYIDPDQSLQRSCDNYFLTRVFLSAHGNGMWYPTTFPSKEDKKTTIDFFENTKHPLIYSSNVSHAMYPQPKNWKRIMGFADDITSSDGLLWKPDRVALWEPMFILTEPDSLCSSGIRRGSPVELDISAGTRIDTINPTLWFSLFAGNCGNITKNQSMVPFKGGLFNTFTNGDFYYKFGLGGTTQAVDFAIGVSLQRKLVFIPLAIVLALFIFIIVSISVPTPDHIVVGFVPICSLLMSILMTVSVFVLLTGSAFSNFPLIKLFSNKLYLVLIIILSLLFIIGLTVLPIVSHHKITSYYKRK
jgi:hypothetical protein